MPYKCAFCGQEHDDLPMDIAFRKPEDYLRVPEHERTKRVKMNEDLCAIDSKTYLIRGVMPIPVHGSEQNFVWGVWVIVDHKSYLRYMQLWSVDGSKEPPFRGWLSAVIPGYPDTYRLEVKVQLADSKSRPQIRLRPSKHPLAQEQMNGISQERLHEILKTALPTLFRNPN